MRRRYVLTLCAVGLLIIVAIVNGSSTEGKLQPTSSPVASPLVPRCQATAVPLTPSSGVNIERSGTPITISGNTRHLLLDRITIEPGTESGNWCYTGKWLFKVDSGTIQLSV